MSEWIEVKTKMPDPEKDEGWYVVLIEMEPCVVYFSFRNWNRPWHIDDKWKDPTHYMKLPSIPEFWSNRISRVTMD